MSVGAGWRALASIAIWLPIAGIDGPGVKTTLMRVPKVVFICCSNSFAPSVPPNVPSPSISATLPSLSAAAAGFFRSGETPSADAVAGDKARRARASGATRPDRIVCVIDVTFLLYVGQLAHLRNCTIEAGGRACPVLQWF